MSESVSVNAVRETATASNDFRPLLEVKGLKKHFSVGQALFARGRAGVVKAVDGIDFTIGEGETLGLIGESGCGKTTTTKVILLLEHPTAGSIHFDGRDVLDKRRKDVLQYRKEVQAVFQDPYSSLSPRMRVGDILAEPLEIHSGLSKAEIRTKVGAAMELVGLSPEQARLFPHEFSGGQRQRIAIARAVAAEAKLIVLDEPVSALDVSIRAQIMSLLDDLQKRLGVSYLFIGHDLATVAYLSHRIAVMYLGRIVEVAESVDLCSNPLHPYTKALFAAALPSYPDEVKEELVVTGEVPSALNPPSGCHFHPRCPMVMDHCPKLDPVLKEVAPNHWVACHLY